MRIKMIIIDILLIMLLILIAPYTLIFIYMKYNINDIPFIKTSKFICNYYEIKELFKEFNNILISQISNVLIIKTNNYIYYVIENKNLKRLIKINKILKSDIKELNTIDYHIKLDINNKIIFINKKHIQHYNLVTNKLLNIYYTYKLSKYLNYKNYKKTIFI